MIIKKWNDTSNAWVELYPKTKASELYASDGTTGIFDSDTKIKPAYLPDFVFGGMQFQDSLPTNTGYAIMGDKLHATWLAHGQDSLNGMIGKYFIAEGDVYLQVPTSSQYTQEGAGTEANPTRYYLFNTLEHELEEDTDASQDITIEHGDWLVITDVTGSGTSTSDPYLVTFAVVNNTYQTAGYSVTGVVKLGSGSAQSVNANSVTSETGRTYAIQNDGDGRLVVNVPWSDTNTTYSAATSSALGLIKVGFTSDNSAREYAVQLDGDNEAYVSVPWTDNTFRGIQVGSNTMNGSDTFSLQMGSNMSLSAGSSSGGVQQFTISATNTTYTAGEGLTLSGTEFRSTYPLYVGASAPTVATEDEVENAIWFDL